MIAFQEGRYESFEYGRYGNPTTRVCEEKLAELEGAETALLSTSGMNSATTMLLALVPAGEASHPTCHAAPSMCLCDWGSAVLPARQESGVLPSVCPGTAVKIKIAEQQQQQQPLQNSAPPRLFGKHSLSACSTCPKLPATDCTTGCFNTRTRLQPPQGTLCCQARQGSDHPLAAGGHIVTTTDCYRRTRQFIQTVLPKMNIGATVIDPSDMGALEAALQRQPVSLYFSESPTNPFLRCVDVATISALCHRHGALVCIDSTFATPINQRALELGADLVLHSATKYLSGHNDVLAGACSRAAAAPVAQQLRTELARGGGCAILKVSTASASAARGSASASVVALMQRRKAGGEACICPAWFTELSPAHIILLRCSCVGICMPAPLTRVRLSEVSFCCSWRVQNAAAVQPSETELCST